MEYIAPLLRAHPELAIFLVLALGFFLGKVHFGQFKLGAPLGCLFAGVLIGQMTIPIDDIVKDVFFSLFLFATGYKVGPQFFTGLKKGAVPQLLLALLVAVTCLLTVLVIARFVPYDMGTAAGLLAGGFSESTVIGTAASAIKGLSLSDAEKTLLINRIPIAYAATYLIGTTASVWLLSAGIPKIFNINLKEEARNFQTKMGLQEDDDVNEAYHNYTIRALKIGKEWNQRTLKQIEQSLTGGRMVIYRIRQGNRLVDPQPGLVIREGDVLAIGVQQQRWASDLIHMGSEVIDKELLSFPMKSAKLMITDKNLQDRTILSLATEFGEGLLLDKLMRGGQELPFNQHTQISVGDVLLVYGAQKNVEQLIATSGFKNMESPDSDIAYISLGIVLGGLLGMLVLPVFGIQVTLSTHGGALVMGLVFGWLATKLPSQGQIPEQAIWVFDNLGLALFLSVIGINAGPSFFSGLEAVGYLIIPFALVTSLLPIIVGFLIGYFVMRMNPILLLGALCGSSTSTTALKAVQDASGSKLPVLAYTIPYAAGNVILTAWGPVLVSLMS